MAARSALRYREGRIAGPGKRRIAGPRCGAAPAGAEGQGSQLVFAVNVPLLLAFSVARYQPGTAAAAGRDAPPAPQASPVTGGPA
jgi:hypothetical protein